jgi:hypothetical protein
MTPAELNTLIRSDPQALALASSGAADLCALRCMDIAPRVVVRKLMTDVEILALYASPADGEEVCQIIDTAARTNAVVSRVWKWAMPPNSGIDVGDARIRSLLTMPVAQGGLGLTQAQAAPILAAAEVQQTITGADVSTAFPYPPVNEVT